MRSVARLVAAALALAVFPAAGGRGADIPEVARALLEQKKAPPLPKPTGQIIRVTTTAELERAITVLQSNRYSGPIFTIFRTVTVFYDIHDILQDSHRFLC